MPRVSIITAAIFLSAPVFTLAAENSSQEISSLQEEIRKVRAEYEVWAARVDRANQDAGVLPEGLRVKIDAPKQQGTVNQDKSVGNPAVTKGSGKAAAEAKSNAQAAQPGQKQDVSGAAKSTAAKQGNIFKGAPLYAPQNSTLTSNTSTSQGVRISYPKVTIIGGTNSTSK